MCVSVAVECAVCVRDGVGIVATGVLCNIATFNVCQAVRCVV